MKLAVIDLDSVVANVDARFAEAEQVKRSFLESDSPADEREVANVYWRAVFTPERVALDTLIEGAKERLEALCFTHGYQLLFLTSRPEAMRAATVTWLFEQDALFYFEGHAALLMKPPASQYTKTVVWKPGIIQTFAIFYGAGELLVVDDEQVNLNEITKYTMTLPPLTTAHSLAEAVAKLDGTWQEPDPFLPPEE